MTAGEFTVYTCPACRAEMPNVSIYKAAHEDRCPERPEPCPVCGEIVAGLAAQSEHMTTRHPEVVEARRAEATRWDGWEDS